MAFFLENLPSDVIYYFLFERSPEEICKFACLSKMWRELATDSRIWKKLCRERWVVDAEHFQLRFQQLSEIQNQNQKEDVRSFREGLIWKQLYKENYERFKQYAELTNAAKCSLWENIVRDMQHHLDEHRTAPTHVGDLWIKVMTPWTNLGVETKMRVTPPPLTHPTLKATKRLPFSWQQIVDVLLDSQMRPLWDRLLSFGVTVRRLDKCTDITFLVYEGAECLLLRHYEWTVPPSYECALQSQKSKNVFYLAEYSINEDSLDPETLQDLSAFKFFPNDWDNLRLDVSGSGWLVEEISDLSPSCKVTYVVSVNTSEEVPNDVYFSLCEHRSECLVKIEEYLTAWQTKCNKP
jgi:hypothetical protein